MLVPQMGSCRQVETSEVLSPLKLCCLHGIAPTAVVGKWWVDHSQRGGGAGQGAALRETLPSFPLILCFPRVELCLPKHLVFLLPLSSLRHPESWQGFL